MDCAVQKTLDLAFVAGWVLRQPEPLGRVARAVFPRSGVASVMCRDESSRMSSGSHRSLPPGTPLQLPGNPWEGSTPRIAMTPTTIARLVFCEKFRSIRTFRETKVIVGRPSRLARFDSCHLLEVEKCMHC